MKNIMSRTDMEAAAAVAGLYFVMGRIGIGCPILFLTGVSCAGCGMTRAWLSLLHLDLAAAYHCHPLFWVPPLVLFAWIVRQRIPRRLLEAAEFVLIVLFLIVYVVRLQNPEDTIVVCDPQSGLFYRLAMWALDLFKSSF